MKISTRQILVFSAFALQCAVAAPNETSKPERWVSPQAQVVIDRSHNLVEVSSDQPREKIAASIAEEGYAVAP